MGGLKRFRIHRENLVLRRSEYQNPRSYIDSFFRKRSLYHGGLKRKCRLY